MKSLKLRMLIAGTLSLLLYGVEAFAHTSTTIQTVATSRTADR